MRPQLLGEPWDSAARMAAWAPDDARDLLASLAHAGDGQDEVALACTSELIAKAFAVTGAWELACDGYLLAAESWQPLDPGRARALGELAKQLPLAPFRDDAEAIEAERALVARVRDEAAAPPLLLRAVTEIRRALAPRPITGTIEAACGLAPMEAALVFALASEPRAFAGTTIETCHELLAPSQWYEAGLDRVVALGLVRVTPEVAAHPRLVSRLRGRTAIEMPRGLRVERIAGVAARVDAGEQRRTSALLAGGIARVGAGQLGEAARLVATRGVGLCAVHPIGGDPSELLAEAAVELRAHGAMLAIEHEAWSFAPRELIASLAPIVVAGGDDALFADDPRAFQLLSSPR